MVKVTEDSAQAAFRDAQERWRGALEAHRLAPPNAGFSARLAGLAAAARAEAVACREADAAGFEWPPHRASSSKPPYGLQPEGGRRGPEELWRHSTLDVAGSYEDLAAAAAALADAVEREDRASGLLPRARARRSA